MEILVIVYFVLLITVPLYLAKTENDKYKPACEVHTWIYEDDANGGNFMVCSNCRVLPGQDKLYVDYTKD